MIYLISSSFQGDLVYVNYGRPSDFKILIDKGVNCSGKIVIVRYGRVFRGGRRRYFSPLNKQTREKSTLLSECPRELARKLCHPSARLLCSLKRIVLCSLIIYFNVHNIFKCSTLFIALFQVTNAQKY